MVPIGCVVALKLIIWTHGAADIRAVKIECIHIDRSVFFICGLQYRAFSKLSLSSHSRSNCPRPPQSHVQSYIVSVCVCVERVMQAPLTADSHLTQTHTT